jgi:hypothetical protein
MAFDRPIDTTRSHAGDWLQRLDEAAVSVTQDVTPR